VFEAAGKTVPHGDVAAFAQVAAREFGATSVLFGNVYRSRERRGGELGATRPASVGIELALHAAPSARLLWTARFDHTQQALSENALVAPHISRCGIALAHGRRADALGPRRRRGTAWPSSDDRRALRADPAIDLLGGECVRLAQGRYDAADRLRRGPGRRPRGAFAAHAVPRLTSSISTARPRGPAAQRRRRARDRGRGRRASGAARRRTARPRRGRGAFDAGVDASVLGTAALRDPAFVRDAARPVSGPDRGRTRREGRPRLGGGLARDRRGHRVEVAKRFEDVGVAALVHTDIARDGNAHGPESRASAALADAVSIPVIVSGGISSEDDLVAAASSLRAESPARIAGRALYTGAVDLASALRRLAGL
jgi:phosphoribosylformimino-5-aminoimidazole carboxamide ribotide isomerase